jgi:ribbon-helix-helix CopG family protein
MVKMTFTLDDPTVAKLRQAAARLAKPQSEVVREAIADYADRVGRLSDRERLHLLRVFDTLVPKIPSRSARAVDAEIREIRAARRRGGRRHPAGREA